VSSADGASSAGTAPEGDPAGAHGVEVGAPSDGAGTHDDRAGTHADEPGTHGDRAGTHADEPGTHGDGAGTPRIGMIWAQARGGVIGAGGTMPWHLSEDLKHFKRTTSGAPVVMGRRTWESFPPRFRPLPGRTNIVVTRDDGYAADGAVRAASLEEGLALAREDLARRGQEVPGAADGMLWVIGGGTLYAAAMGVADLLVVTEIDLEVEGDTRAPAIPGSFTQSSAEPARGWHEADSGLRYRILTYAR